MTTYEKRVDALIPRAVKIANQTVVKNMAAGTLCGDDVWSRAFHLAMDELKYENGLIGWRRAARP
jgi:hypothetical protein